MISSLLAVLDCKETATSRESFIRLMNERGYGVDWQDSHKYITYTDLARKQAGEKACKIRNNKLEKYYNMGFGKEELEHEFERNARTAEVRAGKSERTDPRTEPSEPDRAGEQPAEGSLSFVERELRGIDEAVKSRTSKGRAEQAERRRAEQAAHQRAEEASRAVREQQRTTSERHISRNWEPERWGQRKYRPRGKKGVTGEYRGGTEGNKSSWKAVWYAYKRNEAESPGAGGKQKQLFQIWGLEDIPVLGRYGL